MSLAGSPEGRTFQANGTALVKVQYGEPQGTQYGGGHRTKEESHRGWTNGKGPCAEGAQIFSSAILALPTATGELP